METRGVVVGRVLNVREHPYGDKIWLADVDLGRGRPAQIVFGGAGEVVKVHSLVPVAPPGSRLPEGVKIRRRRYRGEVSEGMLCSLAELGWDPNVTDRVAVLDDPNGRLQPGVSLDRLGDNWRSLVANARTDRDTGVLTTSKVFSGAFRLRKSGAGGLRGGGQVITVGS